eukprot:TRINITY_DN47709_c0_g2_i1.p1 TRINITY_DN47709_c0_g2~~TRINITY_DN47709_c0_g2_i1.p1  ORF type:complete len:210 (+),score=44.90 TRINITY_DN47709_c0_g2_i1:56-631(+)
MTKAVECEPISERNKPLLKKNLSTRECFMDLLQDEHGRKLFLEFLESEYSSENLYFLEECELFRSKIEDSASASAVDDGDRIILQAKHIRDHFIVPNSPYCVNISHRTRLETLTRLGEMKSTATTTTRRQLPPSDVFEEATNEIVKLMLRDSFPRFIHSMNSVELASIFRRESLSTTGMMVSASFKSGEFS